MDEPKKITKKLIKNTFINFIIFTAILLTFDFIIYNQVSNSLYENIDKQLENFNQQFKKTNKLDDNKDYKLKQRMGFEEQKEELSPRLIIIFRNENGDITSTDKLEDFSNYIDDIKFDKNNIDNIYNFKIEDKYSYRCINHAFIQDEDVGYVQVLANVDGETMTLENILSTLMFGTIILVIIYMILSYVLSKRTMRPMIQAYKQQTEFVQNASHELRTPLTIIQAKQELLLKEPNKKIIEKSNDINLILKETRRLTKLIKELMDLARVDNGKLEIKKENIKIDDLIKEVANPYEELAKIQAKKIILDLKCNNEIKINKSKIIELIIIVLDNAIKYTNKNDTIKIKTYNKDGKCNIEIQDTGIGISEYGIKHIFDRFYREDKVRSRQSGGTGLGLSIAQTIVSMHNGTIRAIRNNPKGTIILIRI